MPLEINATMPIPICLYVGVVKDQQEYYFGNGFV